MGLIGLIKGFPGKPSHPPLTDVAIGGYTVGVIVLILGAFDFQEPQMAHGALLAISGGIVFGLLAAVTGLLDWLDLPAGTPVRRLATAHLLVMVAATGLFVATWLIQRPGYNHAEVRTGAWIVGLAAEIVLLAGGYLGGSIVYAYGTRVLGRTDLPLAAALVPGRARAYAPQSGGRGGQIRAGEEQQPQPQSPRREGGGVFR
jgi:uncharacterized membrane protein